MPEDVPSMEVLGCQLLEHDQCIDVPQALMIESARKRAHHRKPEFLPKANRPFIGGGDQVELHGTKAHRDGLCFRMLAHGRRDALALRLWSNDVAAVADM